MNGKLTLTELQLIIKDSLYIAFPEMYWVIAEISEIKENYSGHCYLELVEKHPEEQSIRARVRGVIWNNRYRFLRTFFENATGETLREGIKVLVRVKIDYHEIYGLSLVITDIDPAFTLGEMAMKRQQILRKLEDEGVLNMNKDLEFPVVPQRIAVISSRNAAGYTDFMKQLTNNSFGYVFHTLLIDTPMQGNETEPGVLRAFERIAGFADQIDVVVIIRGGGSQTDLSWFDNYNIAYYITQFPLPVITGIGHEKDLSVTDIVANKALKTPTAVADFLVECMNNAENHIIDMSSRIADASIRILEDAKKMIDSCRVKLIPVARVVLSELKEQLSHTIIEMVNTGKEYILRATLFPANQKSRLSAFSKAFLSACNSAVEKKREKLEASSKNLIVQINSRLNSLENSLEILDPANVLKRGFSITSFNGRIVRSRGELKDKDLIATRFHDGSIMSRVEEEGGRRKK
ncbi:MAG: exodeoxyribonuclease VII large subunit [Bacteroidota bacterium]|nr:exodeoxyribonuclease VII large subunit [Bacteroidota bacterium]